MATNNNGILTTGDVMKYCHVSRSTALKWIKSGRLNGYSHPGGQFRVTVGDLLAFLRKYRMPVDDDLLDK